jgi:ABC-type multidrug transport system fused ATPase/permease subunit
LDVLKRLFHYVRPYWVTVLIGGVAMVLSTVAGLAPPMVLRYLYDDVITARRPDRLFGAIAVLVLALFLASLFGAIRARLMHVLGQRFTTAIRIEVYEHLQKLSLRFFDKHQTGEIMSRVTNDVEAVEDFVVHGTDHLVVNALKLIGIGIIMFAWLDWRLGLAATLPLPPLIVSVWVFNAKVKPIYRRVRERLADINAKLQDNLSGIRVIKSFTQEDREFESFSRESLEYRDERIRAIALWSTFGPAMEFLASLGVVLVSAAGAVLALRPGSTVTLGDLIAFLAYVTTFYDPVRNLFRVNEVFQRAIAAGKRIFEILDTEPDIKDAPDAVELRDARGEVAFEHVTFSYEPGDEVLRDVSVVASPGQKVAIVGRSGAGKTSIVNLIPRFYDPDEGRILVDGHDVRTLTQASLRRHIAMVLQDTFLFNGTVRDNIAYARPDATDEQIVEAAKAANAHDFIMDLPNGYETEIGERGIRLSGGQRQRLSIARALLADPRILILDEATSSVDTESELAIQQALERLMEGRTTFVIAHRLSTVKHADKIIALDDGRVAEEGDHASLLRRGGVYRQMYELQFRAQEETAA